MPPASWCNLAFPSSLGPVLSHSNGIPSSVISHPGFPDTRFVLSPQSNQTSSGFSFLSFFISNVARRRNAFVYFVDALSQTLRIETAGARETERSLSRLRHSLFRRHASCRDPLTIFDNAENRIGSFERLDREGGRASPCRRRASVSLPAPTLSIRTDRPTDCSSRHSLLTRTRYGL